tara:strand:+ start:808 stop:1827 length:1020 start_codon:yes stop_codon:yes gene_type:complete
MNSKKPNNTDMEELVNFLSEGLEDEIKEFEILWNEFSNTLTDRSDTTGLPDCLFIYLLIRKAKPKLILEVGTWVGTTLFSIIQACNKNDNNHHIVTIDINNKLVLKDESLKNVSVMNGWGRDCLQEIIYKFSDDFQFDFIFTDADIDKNTSIAIEKLSHKNSASLCYLTHDFVPPSDKGIFSFLNVIKYTFMKDFKAVLPSHLRNWIYNNSAIESCHDAFSKKIVSNNKLKKYDLGHGLHGVNNSIALLASEGFFDKIGFQDYNNYKRGRYYVVDSELEEDLLKLIMRNGYILTGDNLYIYDEENGYILYSVIENEYPRFKKAYRLSYSDKWWPSNYLK